MTEAHLPLDRAKDMPKRARTFMSEQLVGLPAELYGDIMLLTSELVTNVVVHGETPADLRVARGGGAVRVTVHDSGTGTPATPSPVSDSLPSGGRGLIIVAAVARAWGVAELGPGLGKEVWFDFAFEQAEAPSVLAP